MTLLEEIQLKCSPELIAAKNYTEIARIVSEGRKIHDGKTKFTSLGISENFPSISGLPGPLAAEAVFQKLEYFAETGKSNPAPQIKLLAGAVTRQMQHLKTGGMAIGSSAVKQMLDVLVSIGVMSAQEANGLVDVALVESPVSTKDVIIAIQKLDTKEHMGIKVGDLVKLLAPFDSISAENIEVTDIEFSEDGSSSFILGEFGAFDKKYLEVI